MLHRRSLPYGFAGDGAELGLVSPLGVEVDSTAPGDVAVVGDGVATGVATETGVALFAGRLVLELAAGSAAQPATAINEKVMARASEICLILFMFLFSRCLLRL